MSTQFAIWRDMRNKEIFWYLFLLILTTVVVFLPLWQGLSKVEALCWWAIFGGGILYIWLVGVPDKGR